jgi:hypothetical protein
VINRLTRFRSSPEPRFSTSVPPRVRRSRTLPTLSAPRVSSTPSSSRTAPVVTSSAWPRSAPTLSVSTKSS